MASELKRYIGMLKRVQAGHTIIGHGRNSDVLVQVGDVVHVFDHVGALTRVETGQPPPRRGYFSRLWSHWRA